MIKYTNMTSELRCIRFTDGTAQFLGRGESIESDKKTKVVQVGIREREVKKIKRPTAPDVVETKTQK